ncbi:MAG: HD domain-containing protein [Chloroflexota bacterium]|nr:HD domain-containing protein [Chloroflexota bacterium]
MVLAEIPAKLRSYVVAVTVGGPLLAVIVALSGVEMLGMADLGRAVLLTALAAVAYGRPLQVTHKFTYDLSEVIVVAMLLLFPSWLPGVLILVAGGLHHLRRSSWAPDDLFNLGQSVATVTAGAMTIGALRWQDGLGPSLAGFGAIGAVVAAAAVVLAVNTVLIAGVIALDTGGRFWGLWQAQLANITVTFAALVALGLVAALVVRDYPIAMIPLILPAVLVQYTLRRQVQLRADTRASVEAMADMIELRDPYTAGHSKRVATLARMLAVRLGLTGEEADLIETAGRVHDIAKVAISEAVLLKPGPLTGAEWVEMKSHPVKGAEVIHRFAGYRECEALVRHHHERWDGAGYPDGLAGEAIPLGARILAVADSFDALSSSRPYRSALGQETVLRMLEEGAGTQWDRRVVEELVAVQRERETPVAAGASRPVPA